MVLVMRKYQDFPRAVAARIFDGVRGHAEVFGRGRVARLAVPIGQGKTWDLLEHLDVVGLLASR